MLIRKLSIEDATQLLNCRILALLDSPNAFLTTHAEVKDTPLSTVQNELTDPEIQYIGAFDNSELIGFMRFVRGNRDATRHTAQVRSVFVRLAYRGAGLGRNLLAQLVQAATSDGIELLTITVRADNQPAIALYKSAGFSIFGVEPSSIKRDGKYFDQIHMFKNLPAA